MVKRWSVLIGLALVPVVVHGQYFMIPAERQTPSELERSQEEFTVSSASESASSEPANPESANPPSMMVPAPANASSSASSAITPRSETLETPPPRDTETVPPITDTTPLPQPSPVAPVKIAPLVPVIKVFVTVTSPNGGETVELKKSTSQYVTFEYGGPLDPSSGNYSYRVELWRSGTLLGNTSTLDRYQLNPHESSKTSSFMTGEYWGPKPPYSKEKKRALPGGGYAIRVVLIEAVTPPGKPTEYKELASDLSDGTFTYTGSTEVPAFIKPEPLWVKVGSPNGGEAVLLTDKTASVSVTYGGTFNMEKSGNYEYRIELLRHGVVLGNISNFDTTQLNPYKSSVNYGGAPGEYWMTKPGAGKELKKAEPGAGYQFRATLLEAVTPPGEPTIHKQLVSDVSDGTFSYVTSVHSAVIRASELETLRDIGVEGDAFVVIGGGETLSDVSVLLPFAARLREAELLKKVTVRGWDPVQKVIVEPFTVKNAEDLGEHVAALAVSDEHIKSVEVRGTGIEMHYGMPGHLFGFIPVTMNLRSSVDLADDAETRVKVRFPWYRFLVSTRVDRTEVESELRTKLDQLSEMGEMEQLRLQMQMDRMSKALSTLSNILKKISDTASGITQNIK